MCIRVSTIRIRRDWAKIQASQYLCERTCWSLHTHAWLTSHNPEYHVYTYLRTRVRMLILHAQRRVSAPAHSALVPWRSVQHTRYTPQACLCICDCARMACGHAYARERAWGSRHTALTRCCACAGASITIRWRRCLQACLTASHCFRSCE